MEPVFFFKNMAPSEETQLREYFFTKLPKFEKIVARFSADSMVFHVKGEKFKKHSAYEVELTLAMPGGTYKACEASHMITKAVDLAKDRLDMQIKKAILSVRRGHRSIRARNKLKMRVTSPVE